MLVHCVDMVLLPVSQCLVSMLKIHIRCSRSQCCASPLWIHAGNHHQICQSSEGDGRVCGEQAKREIGNTPFLESVFLLIVDVLGGNGRSGLCVLYLSHIMRWKIVREQIVIVKAAMWMAMATREQQHILRHCICSLTKIQNILGYRMYVAAEILVA